MSVKSATQIMETIFAAEGQSFQKKDVQVFGRAVHEAVEKGLSLQTIEKALRTAESRLFLIARSPESFYSEKPHVQLSQDMEKQKYFLYIKVGARGEQPWFTEFTDSKSYEENFEKLKETAIAILL
ncbi:MAG TPA: hypothetical protein VHK67_01460 [Rhabdochlamydiaceae bacterium]|jgi:hypothetical protein|nr:hypothetical protein [Rhabdochlamydiaceae bacterium]